MFLGTSVLWSPQTGMMLSLTVPTLKFRATLGNFMLGKAVKTQVICQVVAGGLLQLYTDELHEVLNKIHMMVVI